MPHPDLTEEAMLNPPKCGYHPEDWSKWRRYRIEYGFECSCPEGVVYLPEHVDPDEFQRLLNDLLKNDNRN